MYPMQIPLESAEAEQGRSTLGADATHSAVPAAAASYFGILLPTKYGCCPGHPLTQFCYRKSIPIDFNEEFASSLNTLLCTYTYQML